MMISSRVALRAARASRGVRVNAPAFRRNVRFASDSAAGGSHSGTIAQGVIGGSIASILICYGFYYFSGMSTAASTAKQMKSYYDSAVGKLKVEFKDKVPESNEAIETLKQTAYKYASFVPGGRGYVDKAFDDLDIVRKKHGDEVDDIVKEAYGELASATKKGLSVETATDIWDTLSKHLQRLGHLAADAGQDILNNHPELKDKMGGSFDQLKQLGDNLGPEAKKQVDETWKEVQEIVSKGFQWDTVSRIQKLIQDKQQALKKFGEQAWEKGYEQVKPMLEKNPEVKKLVEENMDTLKNGNVAEALSKVKDAVSSGNFGDLQQYIDSAKQKGQDAMSGGLGKWLDMVPGGSKILPQLQKLKHIAETQGQEAEQLAKDTMNDIIKVLDKRSGEVEKMYKEAEKKAKE